MQMRTDPDRGTTPLGHPAVEPALESLPFVSRACVARPDARETVVLVSVDPGRFDDLESGSPVKEEAPTTTGNTQIHRRPLVVGAGQRATRTRRPGRAPVSASARRTTSPATTVAT